MSLKTSISRWRAKIRNMGISKTSDHINIKIKITNPSQEPPASSKSPNQDLKDMDVLCTFKIQIELKFKTSVYQRPMTISEIKDKTTNPSQEPPAFSRATS